MTAPAPSPADAAVRRAALNPTRSFLVQAPAGSGKTELLIQRYLRLLACVDDPEEILAVTFTRKAAAEMRIRILRALDSARTGQPPAPAHLRVGYELACAVADRDGEHHWNLAGQPGRLRIDTIDAVNAWLANRAPLSTGVAAVGSISDDPEKLYRDAARRTIGIASGSGVLGNAVTELLNHCDNQAARLEELLVRMLARRDQWLPRTGSGPGDRTAHLRSHLEANLGLLVEDALRALVADLPTQLTPEIIASMGHAVTHAPPDSVVDSIADWGALTSLPEPIASTLPLWRFLAATLLTREGQWRKQLTRTQGFPPEDRPAKARALDLIQQLSEIPRLDRRLHEVGMLPDPVYDEWQWQILEALLRVLPVAAAELKQVFAAAGATDFAEVAQEALAALGDEQAPSEIGLTLDYRLRHILLDEFQDTSAIQFELLKRLTAGWEPGDGRSLFLVGDPMQSIYRFREAEVGLYLDARRSGIGSISLDFLRLETNFRSDPAIVAWVNRVFCDIFPAHENPNTGAVPFAPSTPYREAGEAAGVTWHAVPYGDQGQEAHRIAELVEQCRHTWPTDTVGILVRSRRHLAHLAPALRQAGIPFTGTDLESLDEQSPTQDLLALTRALAHRGDRLAWLALLRTPWCGLTLADLHGLAAHDHQRTIWELIRDPATAARLSADGHDRLTRFRATLEPALLRRGRLPLRDWVQGTWLELGGPATLSAPGDRDLVDRYFELLDLVDAGGDCEDGAELRRHLRQQMVGQRVGDGQVQLMTMHRAKGLEFDTVILPGLAYPTRKSPRPLLLWDDLPQRGDDAPRLILAPLGDPGENGIYDLLWEFERRRDALEQDRLLYVATTRARKRLHAFAQLQWDAERDGVAEPGTGTLLGNLWPLIQDELPPCTEQEYPRAHRGDRSPDWGHVALRRLPRHWRCPDPPPQVTTPRPVTPAERQESVTYEWAGQWAMDVGSVVHRWLQHIADIGAEHYDADELRHLQPVFRRMLQSRGTPELDLDKAVARVTQALRNVLEDERGGWILSGGHQEAGSELSLTAADGGETQALVLDRTFVTEQNDRWIIDYKISTHEGGDLAGFLESEARRYQPQLKQYRNAMRRMDDRPVRTALYFPLLKAFYELDVDDERYSE